MYSYKPFDKMSSGNNSPKKRYRVNIFNFLRLICIFLFSFLKIFVSCFIDGRKEKLKQELLKIQGDLTLIKKRNKGINKTK